MVGRDAWGGVAPVPASRSYVRPGRRATRGPPAVAARVARQSSCAASRADTRGRPCRGIACPIASLRPRLSRRARRVAPRARRFQPAARACYRVKYASRGPAKHRLMTPVELMARLAALVPHASLSSRKVPWCRRAAVAVETRRGLDRGLVAFASSVAGSGLQRWRHAVHPARGAGDRRPGQGSRG
jgi:hypothetical protein